MVSKQCKCQLHTHFIPYLPPEDERMDTLYNFLIYVLFYNFKFQGRPCSIEEVMTKKRDDLIQNLHILCDLHKRKPKFVPKMLWIRKPFPFVPNTIY